VPYFLLCFSTKNLVSLVGLVVLYVSYVPIVSAVGYYSFACRQVGSTIIALNGLIQNAVLSTRLPDLNIFVHLGPQEQTVSQITDFQKLFLAPGFVCYAGVLIATSLSIIFYFGPKYVFVLLSSLCLFVHFCYV
jgi:hypothetical protein